MKKVWPFLWTVIVLLACAWIFVFLVLIKPDWFNFQPSFGENISTLAMILTALATLILANAAFKNIHDSNEQEKHRRKDALSRERRDRDANLLNEIIEWAEDVAKLNFKIYNFVEARISKESWVENGIGEIVSQFQVIEAKGVYINSIALSSFKEIKKLSKAVKGVNKEIRELVDSSVERLDGKVTTEAVTEHMNLLRLKITELFKEVARIKTADIG